MDVLKQLAPYYRKYEELSVENLNESDYLCSSRSLRTSVSSGNYEELARSLSSTMHLANADYGQMTKEDFESSLSSLFGSCPRPPIHVSASGPYACITSVPPLLLCDSTTLSLYESILYGSHSIDSLINSGTSQLLERFLFMRPVAICNAYMQSIRAEHDDKPEFVCSPHSFVFSQNRIGLNEPLELSITVTNLSSSQKVIEITPIASHADSAYTLEISDSEISLKKGRSASVHISITFTQGSVNLSKLVLFTTNNTTDFINISASSIPKVFGVDPVSLPSMEDEGLLVPSILVLLKRKLIAMKGLQTTGIFRLSCEYSKGEAMIDYIDSNSDRIKSENDLPIDDVNVITFLIKFFYRSLPMSLLDVSDGKIYEKCSTLKDCQQIVERLPPCNKNLLMWLIKLMVLVSNNAVTNLMNSMNCAILIAPNLFTIEDVNEFNRLLPYINTFCNTLIISN